MQPMLFAWSAPVVGPGPRGGHRPVCGRRGVRAGLAVVVAITALPVHGRAQEITSCGGDAELQAIFQTESTFQTSELFAAAAGPVLEVPSGVLDLYIGLVSQLPRGATGIQAWTLLAGVSSGVQLVSAGIENTVAASVSSDPPGLFDGGFRRTELFAPEDGVGQGVASSVVLALLEPVTLEPVGTATVLRLRIAGEDGDSGTARIVRSLDELEGGGASLLPQATELTVAGATRHLDCAGEVTVRFVDPSRRCAAPPPDALEPYALEWEAQYDFTSTSYGRSLALTPEGGAVITGPQSSRAVYLISVGPAGEELWRRSITRPDRLLGGGVVAPAPGGGYIVTGEATSTDSSLERDLYLVKTDDAGDVEWDLVIGARGIDERGLGVTAAKGGFVVAGFAHAGSASLQDIYLVRVDASGAALWDRRHESATRDVVHSVEAMDDGGFLVVGSRDDEAYVLGTDADGEVSWERTIAPEAPYREAVLYDGVAAGDGDFLAAGAWIEPSGPTTPPLRAATLVVRLGADGEVLDTRVLPDRGRVRLATAVALHPAGGYLVAGVSRTYFAGEFYLARFDAGGSLLSEAAFGSGILDVSPVAAAVLADGSVVFSGTSSTLRPAAARVRPVPTLQRPGDVNQDAVLDLGDPVCLLDYLFGSGEFPLPCGDGTSSNAANLRLVDGNADGAIDISDAIYLIGFLFLGGGPPALGTDCIAMAGCPGVCRG